MKALKSLSIIVPVYNGELYIRDAVSSILGQSYLPEEYEIILVDDGSTDNSLMTCREMESDNGNVRCISLGSNQGVAKARNTGINAAVYEHLAFLDQDDIWDKDKIAVQSRAIHDYPDVDYLLAMQSFTLLNSKPYPKWFKKEWADEPQKGIVFSTLLIEKSTFVGVGMLDEKYQYGADDADWFFRAKDSKKFEMILPNTLLYRRLHEHNASQRTKLANQELLHAIKKKLDRSK